MNKYEIDEILSMAIMTKTAHVLVEGVDDVRIYEKLSSGDCEVYAIESIEGYSGGCDFVKDAIQDLNSIDSQGILDKYVVGIIDRDVGYFRNGNLNMPALFTLAQYSIESHFVNSEVLNKLLVKLTHITEKQVTPLITVQECIDDLDGLYYFSLEALQGAIDSSYSSVVGYGDNIGRRKDENTMQSIMAKSDVLDQLSASKNLGRSISELKIFVKGKWLLKSFSEGLEKVIKDLPRKCKAKSIMQCRVCQFDDKSSCLFKIKDGISHKAIYSLAMDIVDNNELNYVRDMLQRISATAKA
ncbi:DUF4435 domain-containing protein [Comamonas terrae]|uniref:DUF4435 domain-containing protein n=1 Tax=Comamonas terrae TaxID=673548 RepID=A0ABW5ULP8_9BURK|nr:DUF4435 domain-containing protein [Comamonas terrae]